MRIDATLISHCNNGINLNEDKMKTIGDRIEQLLRDFGRAMYEGAAPYDGVFIEYRIHLPFIVSFCPRKSAGHCGSGAF